MSGARRLLRAGEDVVVSAALAAMLVLPLAEMALRPTLGLGISASSTLVQHLTLVTGLAGGALAAREGRLLSLVPGANLTGWWVGPARLVSHGFAGAVSGFLAWAAWELVATEREAGKVLAYGVPVWAVQLVLPAGYAAVALRLLRRSADTWRGRALALALAATVLYAGARPPLPPADLLVPGAVALAVATAAGAPLFTTLAGAALILFWSAGLPIASIPLDHYRLVTNPSLPTIPLFTLAGYFLAEGGASRRLVRVLDALVGRFRGGPAVVTAIVCAFFTTFTGASGVTILALGGLLMPSLLAARYPERTALGLLTGAGSLGLLFPPCLPLILYAVIAQVPMQQMFLGGILPGLLLVAMTAWWGVRQAPRGSGPPRAFDAREARAALWAARWELLLPAVALGSLFGGLATPVEAAALTALYAFVVETFVYRDLKGVRDVLRVTTECGLLVGGVLLILGAALGFTNYLVDAQVPARAVEWVTGAVRSPVVFLLLLNVFLLVVGSLMDIFSAIVVVVPLIVPMAEVFGIDPVHLGIVFLANLELGYLTPPVGMNLFLASYRFGRPLAEVIRGVVPMLLVLLAGVLLITYVPALSTTLPGWLGRTFQVAPP